jgi:Uma2 family endonuclease
MALPALYTEDHTEEQVLDKDWYTEDEYFALEDRSPERWEFLPDGPLNLDFPCLGRIRAMSGGTLDHGEIGGNLVTALNIALRSAGIQTCHVFGSDVKVHPPEGDNTYPDVSMVCGKPDLYQGRRDIFTNPIFVAEVLSPSTQAYDRGRKREKYQAIPTLQHYLIVAADKPSIELYTREEGGWRLEVQEGLKSSFALTALDLSLVLSDLYLQIEFE